MKCRMTRQQREALMQMIQAFAQAALYEDSRSPWEEIENFHQLFKNEDPVEDEHHEEHY